MAKLKVHKMLYIYSSSWQFCYLHTIMKRATFNTFDKKIEEPVNNFDWQPDICAQWLKNKDYIGPIKI